MMFAGSTAPAGWLECNGQAAPTALAAVLGTANVPDLRGEFVRGWDNGRGVDSGRNILTAQADSIGDHQHSMTLGSNFGADGTSRPAQWGSGDVNAGNETAYTDSMTAAETRPRNISMMYIIKT